MKFAKDVKVGDLVNGHEKGWIKVIEITKGWLITLRYSDGSDNYYQEYDRIETAD